MPATSPSLAALCDIASGVSLRTAAESSQTGVPLVQLRNVDWLEGLIDWTDLASSPPDRLGPDHPIRPDDILFAGKGHHNRSVLVLDEAPHAAAASPIFIIRPKDERVIPAFVAWYLNTAPAQAHLRTCTVGTNIPSVSKSCLAATPVPTPPLDVQHRIAAAVRLAHEERALTHQLLDRRAQALDAACLQAIS